MELTLKNTGETFSALWAVQRWLTGNGYSYGSTTARDSRVAVQKGEYTLPQKVHNFDRSDFALVDGWMSSHDYRDGDVVIRLK